MTVMPIVVESPRVQVVELMDETLMSDGGLSAPVKGTRRRMPIVIRLASAGVQAPMVNLPRALSTAELNAASP